MTTAYSNLLGLALPTTGELSGTWGDTVNDYITKYLDDAIANAQIISGSQTAVTLSKTTGSALVSAGSGATGSAQYALIRCTGNPASTLTITVSYSSLTNSQFSKTYLIFNSTSTSQSVVVQGTTSSGTSTGVTITSGEKALIAWNGTDFVKIATQSGTGEFVTVDTTNLEVTNIKAKDGTASIVLTDSTGAVDMSKAVTMSATTQNIDLGTSQTSGTFTVGGAAQTGAQTFDQSTKTHTLNIGTGATESGATKTVNLATAGVSGSTTTMSVGSAVSGAITNLTVNATTTLAPVARSTGAVSYFTVTTPADTGLTASTEVIGSSFTAATRTWATGALTLQRERVFAAPTYAFAGASTLTTAVNVDIGLPVAGTNATITNAYALRADNTLFTGNVVLNNASAALDLTNLEVTNIKAKDGTAAMSIADSTGNVSLNGAMSIGGASINAGNKLVVRSGVSDTAVSIDNGSNSGLIVKFASGLTSVGNDFNQPLVLLTNNTEKVRITSGGQVNIGGNFTSTNNTLQVTGNAAIGYTTAAPTTGLIVAGNVGIGTDSPIARLTVSDSTVTNGTMTLGNNASYNGTLQYIFSTGELRISQVGAASLGTTLYTAGSERVRVENGGNFLLRQSSNAANTSVSFNTTVQNALTLDSSGNLGIGTPTPSDILHLNRSSTNAVVQFITNTGGEARIGVENSAGTGILSGAGAYDTAIRTASGTGISFGIGYSAPAMRLNSSGNLGLGVTPVSGWDTFVAAQIGGTGGLSLAGLSNNVFMASNLYYGSSQFRYAAASVVSTLYRQTAGAHSWHTTGTTTGSAGGIAALSQAMTLDASGNLLVGITSASFASGGGINVKNSSTSNVRVISGSNTGFDLSQDTSGNTYVYNRDNGFTAFATNNTERARITSGGYFKASNDGVYDSSTGAYHEVRQTANDLGFLVSATNSAFTSVALRTKVTATAAGTGFYHIDSLDSAATRIFGVRGDGNTYNTNGTFGTFSDQKLKQDIGDVESQWDDIKAIRFRKYRLKSQVAANPDAPTLLGVVAQELEQTSPGLVDESPDRDADGNDLGTTTKSVKTSVLLMKAAVALQEAMARIEKLEAEVAALKGV